MEFVYATELKKSYQVSAHFYYLNIANNKYLCRSVADIVENTDSKGQPHFSITSAPNAVVVMMNPGAARPVSHNPQDGPKLPILSRQRLFDYNRDRPQILVAPDNAQYQLMRLMKLKAWRHLRIINLSDLCEGNSQKFAFLHRAISEYSMDHPESILHLKRSKELSAVSKDVPHIIVAWGRQPVLKSAATAFLTSYQDVIGLARDYPWYRFASPYRKDQKLSWLREIESTF